MRTYSWLTLRLGGFAIAATALAAGCGEGTSQPPGDFVSDNPAGGDGRNEGETGSAGTTGAGTDSGDDSGQGGDDGGRAIAEADIIQIEGDRLYALSEFGGLTVIDVSNPDQLPVLGRYRAHATPFEMYVENGQVFVMYSDWGSYTFDADIGAYTWKSTSQLMALDASNPAAIQLGGEFEMPGYIQDSRRIGDVLYLVTYEDGWCWGCKQNPNTTVTSLDISDPQNVETVDQLTFDNGDNDEWGGGQRSVSATDERMYIAGVQWDGGSTGHSTIDVIDISDPGGTMFQGASLQVAGQIQSRWQMDEHEGVLRVVSQPGLWNTSQPPQVETFTVASAADIQPLGRVAMVLPRPESLQSVRFDGDRGYAITFEQTDPLFTLDLSDPANPRQVGELEIPGFVYHMEPRGDRVLGVGFDRGNAEGSINVSLFDVADFENPTMLSRVNFGGDWADFGEDQNRIHKAFQIFDDLGLLLVPFSGWIYDDPNDEFGCSGRYHSGVQLIDWADDALALRGVADSRGRARRALLHRDRMLGVSDLAVETFDISNRDAPAKTAELALAVNVSSVAINEGTVARLSTDWWTNEVSLDITSVAQATEPEPLGRVDLTQIIDQHPYECGFYGLYDAELFVHAGYVYILRTREDYENWENSTGVLDVIDARNPAAPSYVQTVELPFNRDYGYNPFTLDNAEQVLKVGSALVMTSTQYNWSSNGEELLSQSASFEVVDLGNPANPTHSASVERPEGLAHGGLLSFGTNIVSWHMRRANPDGSKVRFYLDRLDVSNPASPSTSASVNVPGAVVAYDQTTEHAVTVDFQLQEVALPEEDCWSNPKTYSYDYETNRCIIATRTLHLVQMVAGGATLVDSHDVEGNDGALRGVVGAPGRLYARVGYGWGGGYIDDGYGGYGYEVSTEDLVVFDAWEAGQLEEASRVEANGAGYWLGRMKAMGNRLLFDADNGLGELDATDPAKPELQVHDLYGYSCSDLQISGPTAYCAMGQYGLQALTF